MGLVTTSVRHCAANLARFSGRDSSRQFWPWTIFVFILGTIAAFAAMLPPMLRAMVAALRTMEAARRTGAPEPTPEQINEAFVGQYAADLGALVLPMAAINIVSVLLLAGAVVRRLHDRGRSGLWGLIPLPFLAVSVANMPAGVAIATGRADMTPLERAAASAGSLYWLALLVLIVLLVGDGTRGRNRFGSDPQERD